jgi:hypothetical protein
MKPDYLKIILVGIPVGFIAWFVSIFPSFYIAQFLKIRDFWFYISLILTVIVMSGYLLFCLKQPLKAGAAIISDPKILKSDQDYYQCEFCGNLLDAKHPAKIWQESISGKNILCCSGCYNKKNFGSYKTIIVINTIQFCLGIILVIISPEEKIGWLLLNLILMSLFSILMIIPHELGHVIVAKTLGVCVPGVIIGMGKTVFIKHLLNMSWEFRNIPFGGITIALLADHFKYRRNLFFITIGGPLVNLIFIILFLAIFPITKLFTDIFTIQLSFASAFFLANLVDLLYNLLPIQVDTSIGRIPNDGLNLVVLPFLTEDAVKQRVRDSRIKFSQIEKLSRNKNITKPLEQTA